MNRCYFFSCSLSLSLLVNTCQAGQGQLKVELVQPPTSKTPCRCDVQEIASEEYLIQYLPTEPGRYQLRILFNNHLVQGKTFDTDVYFPLPQTPLLRLQQIFPNKPPIIGDEICLQSKLPSSFLNYSFQSFSIVTTENPSITSIQSQISSNGMSIPHHIERNKDSHLWHLKFRPYTSGTYKIQFTHNGLPLLSKKTHFLYSLF